MPIVGDIGFDLVSRDDLIQFRARIDVDLVLFTIGVLDPIIFTFHLHQRSFDRIFGQAFSYGWFCLFVRHRVSGPSYS